MERKSFALVFLYALLTVRCAYAAVCSDADGTPTPSICSEKRPHCVLDTDTRLCVPDCLQIIDASLCGSYPGCTLIDGLCRPCPAGSYCLGNSIPLDRPAPFEDATGITSFNECHAIVACGSEEVYIYCDSFDDYNN